MTETADGADMTLATHDGRSTIRTRLTLEQLAAIAEWASARVERSGATVAGAAVCGDHLVAG